MDSCSRAILTPGAIPTPGEEPDPELVALVSNPPPANHLSKLNFSLKLLKRVISANSRLKEQRSEMDKGVTLIQFELALLDRLLYKNQNRFRNDRGFKALKILQKSTKKFLDRFPCNVLTNLSSLMPVGIPPVELESTESVSILLPPSTIPQYTAIHVWASSLMAVRVEYCCRSAGIYALQRLELGHFWGVAAHQLAVISRLWVLVCKVKSQLNIILKNLKIIGSTLPGPRLYSDQVLSKIFQIISESEEKGGRKRKKDSADYSEKQKGEEISSFLEHYDLGVKLKRSEFAAEIKKVAADEESFTHQSSTEKSRTVPSKISPELDLQFISDLRCFEDLESFLESETRHRKENKKSAITRCLSQVSWKSLKKNLLLSFNNKLPNKSIKLCRKMLKDSLS